MFLNQLECAKSLYLTDDKEIVAEEGVNDSAAHTIERRLHLIWHKVGQSGSRECRMVIYECNGANAKGDCFGPREAESGSYSDTRCGHARPNGLLLLCTQGIRIRPINRLLLRVCDRQVVGLSCHWDGPGSTSAIRRTADDGGIKQLDGGFLH